MRLKSEWAAVIAALALSACATPPERIAGVPNQGPCTSQDQQRLAILKNKQSQAATNDALGVFLIGVPLASMAGADNEAEIAILKGRCEMYRQAAPVVAPAGPRGSRIPQTVTAQP